MTSILANRDAVLEWGIRGSLLSYMSSARDFEVETTGGALFDLESGVRMQGRSDAAGVVHFEGSVILRAHQGALTLPLVGVQVDSGALSIDDPGAENPDQPGRRDLVVLEVVADATPTTATFTSRLSGEADALFMFNYLPGAAFDPLVIRFG